MSAGPWAGVEEDWVEGELHGRTPRRNRVAARSRICWGQFDRFMQIAGLCEHATPRCSWATVSTCVKPCRDLSRRNCGFSLFLLPSHSLAIALRLTPFDLRQRPIALDRDELQCAASPRGRVKLTGQLGSASSDRRMSRSISPDSRCVHIGSRPSRPRAPSRRSTWSRVAITAEKAAESQLAIHWNRTRQAPSPIATYQPISPIRSSVVFCG